MPTELYCIQMHTNLKQILHVHGTASNTPFILCLGSLEGSSAILAPLPNGSQGSPSTWSTRETQSQWVDCIQASEMCSQDARCSPRYRVMRQCLVGKEKDAMLDNNRDCKAALEVLHNTSLYDCRCKRAMKNELQCLQNYWTIHMGLNEGRKQIELGVLEK